MIAADPCLVTSTPTPPHSEQSYGPYTSVEMQDWVEQGFFEGQSVWVRQIDPSDPDAEFLSVEDVDFSMFP